MNINNFQGGDGRHHVDLDHPLYITDNREGGYDIKTEYDREQEKLFAGVESEFGMVSKITQLNPYNHPAKY